MATATEIDDLMGTYIVDGNGGGTLATNLVSTQQFGRTVVATKDFPRRGEVILREQPLLVWENEGDTFCGYLDAFLEAAEDVQLIILDMYSPPSNSGYMKPIEHTAMKLSIQSTRYRALGVQKIAKLIAVSNINAHEYYGVPPEAFYEVVSNSRTLSSDRSALFAYGSKVAHSCCPNATYSSKTEDGCLEYKVISPIKEGEIITFSYIDNSPSVPTHLRRNELMTTKAFFCECNQCSGLDYARFHWCPIGRCNGKISCVQPSEDRELEWRCTRCGPVADNNIQELLRKEDCIERKLDSLMFKMMLSGGISNVHPSQAKDLVSEAIRTLSTTHFLTLKCMSEYSRICASHAHGVSEAIQMGILRPSSSTPFGSLATLRVLSATANLDYVRGCECVAAKCTLGRACRAYHGGGATSQHHPPVYTCNVHVFHSFMDLKEVPASRWPKGSVSMMLRYVPLCFIQFGSTDQDTKHMEAKLTTLMDKEKVSSALMRGKAVGGGGAGRTNKKKKGKKGRKKK